MDIPKILLNVLEERKLIRNKMNIDKSQNTDIDQYEMGCDELYVNTLDFQSLYSNVKLK